PFNACPFAHIVAFDAMPRVLKDISHDQGRQCPIPGNERNEKKQNDPRNSQWDSDHVNPKVERMPMALPPVLDDPAQRPPAKEADSRSRSSSGIHLLPTREPIRLARDAIASALGSLCTMVQHVGAA